MCVSGVRVLAVATDGTAHWWARWRHCVCLCGCGSWLWVCDFLVHDNYSTQNHPPTPPPPPAALRFITAACTCGYRTMTILVPTGLCHIRRTEITAKWSVKLIIEWEKRADCCLLLETALLLFPWENPDIRWSFQFSWMNLHQKPVVFKMDYWLYSTSGKHC